MFAAGGGEENQKLVLMRLVLVLMDLNRPGHGQDGMNLER